MYYLSQLIVDINFFLWIASFLISFFIWFTYGCERWTVKKAERRRIDAFKLWCWRRLLRIPWTARRSNQSILEISPGISLEGMMLKLKLQYFGHLMWRPDSLDSDAGRDWGQEKRMTGWDGWMASPTQCTWIWVNSGSWCWTRRPGVLQFMGSQRVGHDWVTELNWTEHVLANDTWIFKQWVSQKPCSPCSEILNFCFKLSYSFV